VDCITRWHPLAGFLYLPVVLLLLGGLLTGCQQQSNPLPAPPATSNIQVIEPDDLASLLDLFTSHAYDWDRLGAGVPPLIVTRFPEDHDHRLQGETKKRTFLLSLLPMVLLANQAIEADRQEISLLLGRYEQTGLLDPAERRRLREMAEYYKLPGDPLADQRSRTMLLHRVDILPPSLVLAQAATESGWGTSRLVREGNNLFGQVTDRPGNGILMINLGDRVTQEYERFANLFDSVRSYMRNLNTHAAYRELRDLRAQLRRSGRPLNATLLADGLGAYSTRNEAYIAALRTIIRTSDLGRTNQTFLRWVTPQTTPAFIPRVADLLVSRANAAEFPVR
jgi:Bax protein